ncbi:MAG: hypothetical protein HQM10_16880 [Candidatus Riflebacteria bacterium]|nr:hypothetical protein [Candidatus Riflebacteria bacterium]
MIGINSHSNEILQIISESPGNIQPVALQKLCSYIESRISSEGGFMNRADRPDIYYTLFGLSCAYVLNLNISVEKTAAWLNRFAIPDLTLVNLSSLVKCFSVLSLMSSQKLPGGKAEFLGLSKLSNSSNFLNFSELSDSFTTALSRFRTSEGGFSYTGTGPGFPYAAFLAMNIYQDLEKPIPEPHKLIEGLERCQQSDGRFVHPGSSSTGLLLSTVAGLLTLRQLTGSVNSSALNWIKSQFTTSGGFKADPGSELPDMLSTAVALFALKVCGTTMKPFRDNAKRFVEDHWLNNGSFSATLLDEIGDCEYTYYGLLSLGALNGHD